MAFGCIQVAILPAIITVEYGTFIKQCCSPWCNENKYLYPTFILHTISSLKTIKYLSRLVLLISKQTTNMIYQVCVIWEMFSVCVTSMTNCKQVPTTMNLALHHHRRFPPMRRSVSKMFVNKKGSSSSSVRFSFACRLRSFYTTKKKKVLFTLHAEKRFWPAMDTMGHVRVPHLDWEWKDLVLNMSFFWLPRKEKILW